MADELLTKDEASAILGVGANAMTRYLREIRHIRLGNPRTGKVRIRRADLEAWMERRTIAPQEQASRRTGVRSAGRSPAHQRPPVAPSAHPHRRGRVSDYRWTR